MRFWLPVRGEFKSKSDYSGPCNEARLCGSLTYVLGYRYCAVLVVFVGNIGNAGMSSGFGAP